MRECTVRTILDALAPRIRAVNALRCFVVAQMVLALDVTRNAVQVDTSEERMSGREKDLAEVGEKWRSGKERRKEEGEKELKKGAVEEEERQRGRKIEREIENGDR